MSLTCCRPVRVYYREVGEEGAQGGVFRRPRSGLGRKVTSAIKPTLM